MYNDIKFEGEFKNGKRNGKGKEYFLLKSLLFEGEYKDWKKWNGKEYDPDWNIIYELKVEKKQS